MGKKRSKTSKKNQAQAKQRNSLKKNGGKSALSSLGGIAISKGSSSKSQQSRQQQQQQTSVILHVHNSGNNGNGTKKNSNNNMNAKNSAAINRKELLQKLSQTKSTPKVFLSPSGNTQHAAARTSTSSLQPRLGSIQEDSEQADFQQQMASLHERQWVADKSGGGKGKRRGKKASLSSNATTNSAASAGIFPRMQGSSFSVEKTADDLMNETMHQMVHMTGVGISAVEKTPIRSNKTVLEANFQQSNGSLPNVGNATTSTTSPLDTSSLAAVLRKEQHEQAQFVQQNTSQNPFAALHDDSDEEDNNNDWSLKIQPPASNLQFAPPSFSLLPRETPTPASTPTPSHRHLRQEYKNTTGISSIQSCSFAVATMTTSNCANVSEEDIDPDL